MELLEYEHSCFIDDVFVTCVYHSYMDSCTLNPAGQLLLTRRGNNRIDGAGIVFEL